MTKTRSIAWELARQAGRAAASATRATGELAERHSDKLAKSGEFTVNGAGLATQYTGEAVEYLGTTVGGWAGKRARAAESLGAKATLRATQGVGLVITGGGWLLGRVGRLIRGTGKTVGEITAGGTTAVLKGGADVIDSAAISAVDLKEMREALRAWGAHMERESAETKRQIEAAVRSGRREQLLEVLTVGGVTLSEAIRAPDTIDPLVLQAYEMAYPSLANTMTFAESVARMTPEQLVGLSSGIKGKLFELRLVEHLNENVLPAGYEATMASSATQPGWDLQVSGPNDAVVELIQAKATHSADYVRSALDRYPDIDVISTSEVYAEMAARGIAEGVRDSGISSVELESVLDMSMQAASDQISGLDLIPGGVGMAALGLSVFFDGSVAKDARALAAGKRMGRAAIPIAVGKVALVASQLWWLGVIAGAGTSWLAGSGRTKREQFEALRSVVKTLELEV